MAFITQSQRQGLGKGKGTLAIPVRQPYPLTQAWVSFLPGWEGTVALQAALPDAPCGARGLSCSGACAPHQGARHSARAGHTGMGAAGWAPGFHSSPETVPTLLVSESLWRLLWTSNCEV